MKELERLQQDWNALAEIDPMWAICSDPNKSHGGWSIDEFFRTGKDGIGHVLEMANSLGIPLKKGIVLDFGCGMGRLTQALAEEFETCYGVDISPKMIDLANRFNRFGDKCRYVVNPRNDLMLFADCFFDLIYTENVLQHMPPDLMKEYLKEFVRTLRPSGVLVFQVPIQRLVEDNRTQYLKSLPRYHPQRILNKLRGILIGHNITERYYRLRKLGFLRRLGFSKKWLYEKLGFRPNIPMYCLEESEINELIASTGAMTAHIAKFIDGDNLNAMFVVVKP